MWKKECNQQSDKSCVLTWSFQKPLKFAILLSPFLPPSLGEGKEVREGDFLAWNEQQKSQLKDGIFETTRDSNTWNYKESIYRTSGVQYSLIIFDLGRRFVRCQHFSQVRGTFKLESRLLTGSLYKFSYCKKDKIKKYFCQFYTSFSIFLVIFCGRLIKMYSLHIYFRIYFSYYLTTFRGKFLYNNQIFVDSTK